MPTERGLRAALTLVLIAACDRSARDTPASSPIPRPSLSPPGNLANNCTLPAMPTTLPIQPKRLVAIGDIHGDLAAARAALRAAAAIDASDKWIGGDLVIVQTGDILDRGDDESKIYDLFDKLTIEAKAAGGDIVMLNGNHELMNTALDFRYVTPGGMRDFGGDRKRAFAPGGPWAKRLARYNLVAIIDGSVFSHAGVLGEWVTQLDEISQTSRCWLDAQHTTASAPPIALTSDSSPVWTRAYGIPEEVDCAALGGVLAKLGAKRMVVGHTVQQQGITNACDGKLWRIDVGLAANYGGPIEVLDVSATPRVLRGTR